MRFLRCLLLFFSFLGMLAADEPPDEEEGSIYLPSNEVYHGSYYAVRDTIEIAGTVEGDVYLSGSHIIISGVITGDLIALAGNMEISGRILGNVRVLSAQVVFNGFIEGDATFATANASLMPSGQIQGELLLFAGNAELQGLIMGDVVALASSLTVPGTIGHSLRTFVGKLQVTNSARIKGNLSYRSDDLASIDPKAIVGGEIQYHRSLLRDLKEIPLLKGVLIGSKVATFLMNFFYTFVWGLLLIRMFKSKLEKTLSCLQEAPGKSFVYGLVLLVLLPIVSILLLVTVIGAPFALTLIALNIVSFYTVKIFPILWISNWLFSKWGWKRNKIPTLVAGQVLYCALASLPMVGIFVAFIFMVFGLGAIALSQTR